MHPDPHIDANPTQYDPIPAAPSTLPPTPPPPAVPPVATGGGDFRRKFGNLLYIVTAVVTLVTLLAWVAGAFRAIRKGKELPDLPDILLVSQGWVSDPAAVAATVAALPPDERHFGDTPAGKLVFGDDVPVYLWDAARAVTGDVLPARNQGSVGSCVSFGTAAAVEHLLCAQIRRDRKGEFRPLAQEVIYGGSRVEIGGGRINGDGSVGAWAADWCRKYGVVARGVHGPHDLTRYDEARCRLYGQRGVPDDLEPIAKESPVKSVSLVRTGEEAVKALRQEYPLIVCSNQGFDMTRGGDGFARPSGSWAHCMAIIGYTPAPRRGFWIQNSWGPDAHRGPLGVGDPPAGGFWADFAVVDRMLAQGDSWAFADAVGFPARRLDWWAAKPKQPNPILFAFGGAK